MWLIHAEYSDVNDEYFTHRLIQSFQLSQFIKQTSEKCDVVFVGGDCNMESNSLSYKILTTNAMLNDAWLKKKNIVDDKLGNTCECPDNSYTDSATKLKFPDGKRIDYLLFRANSAFCIWNGVVINNIDSKASTATKEEAKYLLNSKKDN
uniref:Endonuclease/exonuclease/phosphatase domain-containing protein n=1 Tax=Octopus bimaculoides TaxID=37653 RepID=A0A0L8GH21_OCTBM